MQVAEVEWEVRPWNTSVTKEPDWGNTGTNGWSSLLPL